VSPSSFADRFVVVLNRTQDVVNIATSLRAMMNMGLTRLRLVSPEDFSTYRIAGIAHGSEPLIDTIEFFDTLEDAVADASLVIGTTARRRTATYLWSHPREAAPELLRHPADAAHPICHRVRPRGHRPAQRGTRSLRPPARRTHQHHLPVAEPVSGRPAHRYELALAAESASARPLPRPKRDAEPSTALEREALFEQINAALHAIDFYKGKVPEAIMRTMRALARRADVNAREVALLRAMAIEVQKVADRPVFRDAIMRISDMKKDATSSEG
jgi:tRNA C32,U32 (ribose-2'-O)-methylase TrmJ